MDAKLSHLENILVGICTAGVMILLIFCSAFLALLAANLNQPHPLDGPSVLIAGALFALAMAAAATAWSAPRLAKHFYQLNWGWLMLVYGLISVGFFGFFMGVPVFNLLPGIAAGIYTGRRMFHSAAETAPANRLFRRVCRFATLVLLAACIGSALFALASPSTSNDLKGMLNLPFKVSPVMLWGLILIGGGLLLAIQYAITWLSCRLAYKGRLTADAVIADQKDNLR